MTKDFLQTTEELSQDQWWVILLSLITDLPVKEWNEFTNDLIYKDRFSSSHKVVDVIKSFSERCTNTIKKGNTMNVTSVQNQLVYTTVRIVATKGNNTSIGTGFIVSIKHDSEVETFLVTNNHVIQDCDSAELIFCAAQKNLEPDDNSHVTVKLPNLQSLCYKHENLNICLINM